MRAKRMETRCMTGPVGGKCCGCDYDGEDETPCPNRADGSHCEHWWDGPADEAEQEES